MSSSFDTEETGCEMTKTDLSIAIIYCSQTGFTKRYAEWLAEDLGCEAVPYEGRSALNLAETDVLVFCSWFHAASIKGADWVKKVLRDHPNFHVVILATGATPMPCEMWPASEMEAAFERTFPKSEFPDLPHFYCQGGFDYGRLGLPDKIAMRMFFKVNAKAADTDPKAAEMLRVMGDGFDGTNREYLEPIIAHIGGLA